MNGTAEARDFAPVLAQVKPEAERLMAQYPDSRSALLPILHAFQNVEGWVSPEAMAAAGAMLGLPISVVESTASFYTLFFRRPVGKYVLQVCRNLSCSMNGAEKIMTHIRERLNIGHFETTYDGIFSYEEVECLAACDRAPCMQVNLDFVYDLTREKVDTILQAMMAGKYETPPLPQTAKPDKDWRVEQDWAKKSPGARGVSDANDPGGMGDVSGARMIARLAQGPVLLGARPTSERLIKDGAERLTYVDSEHEH